MGDGPLRHFDRQLWIANCLWREYTSTGCMAESFRVVQISKTINILFTSPAVFFASIGE